MFSIVPRRLAEEIAPMMRLADDLAYFPIISARSAAQPLNFFGQAEVQNTEKEFRIQMDLQHFKPEEVKITQEGQSITVSAKHEEKKDDQGFISRELTRIFTIPEDVDPKSVASVMNDRGNLSIKAQKRQKALEPPTETAIPVEFK